MSAKFKTVKRNRSMQLKVEMRMTRFVVAILGLSVLLTFQASAGVQEGAAQSCVNINTANLEELQRIIHIGPERAEQILQLRRQRRFETVDELVRVRGIAAARLADIKQQGLVCVQ